MTPPDTTPRAVECECRWGDEPLLQLDAFVMVSPRRHFTFMPPLSYFLGNKTGKNNVKNRDTSWLCSFGFYFLSSPLMQAIWFRFILPSGLIESLTEDMSAWKPRYKLLVTLILSDFFTNDTLMIPPHAVLYSSLPQHWIQGKTPFVCYWRFVFINN